MRVGYLTVTFVAAFGTLTSAEIWVEDPRCPGYGKWGRRRTFDPNENAIRLFEDGLTETGKQNDGSNIAVMSNKNLRGIKPASHRHLNNITNFQIKMYWEEGYCWQEEWEEREWCLECEASCGQDDHIWLQKCDEGEVKQRFTYENINQTIKAVKIKPLNRQDLCWTRTGINEMQLKPCGDSYKDEEGRDLQILIGFEEIGKFELHPNGHDKTNPGSSKCMDNHHHPKAYEIIRADYCTTGRKNKTSNWIVFNSKGPGSTTPLPPSSGGGLGVGPKVVSVNSSYCTPEAPCPQCYGDCDTNDDCQGHLQCYQRNGGQKVPSCSGGEGVLSGTDFCIDPNWQDTRPPTLPSDPSPTMIPEMDPLGIEYCSETNKCGLCQGDCDTNDDCKEGLICFQRNSNEDVPGCAGKDGSNTDYCIHPY